ISSLQEVGDVEVVVAARVLRPLTTLLTRTGLTRTGLTRAAVHRAGLPLTGLGLRCRRATRRWALRTRGTGLAATLLATGGSGLLRARCALLGRRLLALATLGAASEVRRRRGTGLLGGPAARHALLPARRFATLEPGGDHRDAHLVAEGVVDHGAEDDV